MKRTLFSHLDVLVDPAATEGHGKQLHDVFMANGVHMKLGALKKTSKRIDKHDLVFKSASFTGRMGEITLRIRNQVKNT